MIWNDKRYHSLDYFLKETFGCKVYKISIHGGMTCPNRDGSISTGGCSFCSAGGSGEFTANRTKSITEQIEEGKQLLFSKAKNCSYIAYFQAFSNTYAPVTYLRKIFTEAIKSPDIVALSIATRPDCLPTEVLELLTELNQQKPVFIELGLQTSKEATATLVNRGYHNIVFEDALRSLKDRNIPVIVHCILGLPYETPQDMFETIRYIRNLQIQGIKLQLMHVLKGTALEDLYYTHPEAFLLLNQQDYIEVLIACIELLPPEIVIHRITGDGPRQLLIAPLWSLRKKNVFNTIQREMKCRDSYQGKMYERGEQICQLKL